MASPQPLRVVKANEKPRGSRRKLTVTQAASSGTPRELLVAMRDRVAKDVENPNTASRDLAALTRRLMEITREIEALDARESEAGGESSASPDDEWEAV